MSTETIERPASVTKDLGPGDFRSAAVAKINEITDKYSDFVMGAGAMAPHAWDLLEVAVQRGFDIMEKNIPRIQDHAGGLKLAVKKFLAALHGVLQLIQAGGESCWRTTDDMEVLDALRVDIPTLDAMVDALDSQCYWDVDLGNKPAADQSDEARPAPVVQPRAEPVAAVVDERQGDPEVFLSYGIDAIQAMVDAGCEDAVHGVLTVAKNTVTAMAAALQTREYVDLAEADSLLSSLIDLCSILVEHKDDGSWDVLGAAQCAFERSQKCFDELRRASHA